MISKFIDLGSLMAWYRFCVVRLKRADAIADVKFQQQGVRCQNLSSHNIRVFIINKSKPTMKQFSSVQKGEEKKEELTDVEHKASYLKLAYESAMDMELQNREWCSDCRCCVGARQPARPEGEVRPKNHHSAVSPYYCVPITQFHSNKGGV